jgi:3-deoxy-D-manno-octulosonic-acid transferase
MALSPQQKARLKIFAGRSIGRFIAWVDRTSRVVSDPADVDAALRAPHPAIVATWHGQFMMLVTQWPKDLPVGAMVARHGDAELIGKAMERFNVELIRGAGAGQRKRDRGGAQALRGAVKALQSGKSFVMTADIPPGPARRCGEGIILMARLSGRPILPVAAASSRYHALKTWSRMTINLPYSTMGYAVGSPIFVPHDADASVMEMKRLEVEASLNAAMKRAYALAGADPARATPPSEHLSGLDLPPGMRLRVYRAGTSLLRPVAPVLLSVRERQGKEDRRRRGERLGRPNAARPEGALIWVHAASVGETNAVLPLIHALAEQRPDLHFLLTTGTVTSAGLAAQRLPANALHQYVPLDAPQYARRFIEHWKPNLAIFTESEIWPNLILEARAASVPLVLVNARMSERTFKRWRRNTGLSRPIFTSFDVVLAQNETLARRFKDLGVRKVIIAGNLKIDSPPPPADPQQLDRLKTALAGRPVMVAASTHDGEETIVAQAHRRLARELPGFCTIIAPRHPERGTGIAEALKAQGLVTLQRSTGALPNERCDVYIADTIGELGTLYALAPVAFVGGSLVAHGGQNPIEAVRHGTAVLTGPHWHNFRDAYDTLLRHHGAIEVLSAEDLAAQALRLLRDPQELAAMSAGATLALQALGGALQKTLTALSELLPVKPGLMRAS